nr:hypothetical protein [Strawberry chlorotic fleck-associated virus]
MELIQHPTDVRMSRPERLNFTTYIWNDGVLNLLVCKDIKHASDLVPYSNCCIISKTGYLCNDGFSYVVGAPETNLLYDLLDKLKKQPKMEFFPFSLLCTATFNQNRVLFSNESRLVAFLKNGKRMEFTNSYEPTTTIVIYQGDTDMFTSSSFDGDLLSCMLKAFPVGAYKNVHFFSD